MTNFSLGPSIHPIGCEGNSGYNVIVRGSASHLYDAGCVLPNLFDQLSMERTGDPLWEMHREAAPDLWNVHARYAHMEGLRLSVYAGTLGRSAVVVGLKSNAPVRMVSETETVGRHFAARSYGAAPGSACGRMPYIRVHTREFTGQMTARHR